MENLENFKNIVPLNEGSLSRIWRHITEHDAAVLTAFRDADVDCVHTDNTGQTYSKKDNQQRNKELRAALLSKRYTVISMDGIYVEKFGEAGAKAVNENSYLVVNTKNDSNFKETIAKLGEFYCQDSVLIIPQGGKSAYLLGTNHADFPGYQQSVEVGNFKPKGEGEFMSKKNNASFTFEDFDGYTRMGKWGIVSVAREVNSYLEDNL